ncbi:UBP-type zinc finger domain-containing protein [Psychromicrobium sp. YIM B11713]|uniref:UBP-type zinc finger domain-containing protein n=1 Tax=Psychromicrobium sp. YIM B11713 TaxID=3145233 RepID=UPI00374E6510
MASDLIPGINPQAEPSGTGCTECLSEPEGWWVHLRRCAECGHIACCDSSPAQHSSAHVAKTGHPVITSFEPGEDWFYDFTTEAFSYGPRLADPQSHPVDQPVPAPADRVPVNWEELIHR